MPSTEAAPEVDFASIVVDIDRLVPPVIEKRTLVPASSLGVTGRVRIRFVRVHAIAYPGDTDERGRILLPVFFERALKQAAAGSELATAAHAAWLKEHGVLPEVLMDCGEVHEGSKRGYPLLFGGSVWHADSQKGGGPRWEYRTALVHFDGVWRMSAFDTDSSMLSPIHLAVVVEPV